MARDILHHRCNGALHLRTYKWFGSIVAASEGDRTAIASRECTNIKGTVAAGVRTVLTEWECEVPVGLQCLSAALLLAGCGNIFSPAHECFRAMQGLAADEALHVSAIWCITGITFFSSHLLDQSIW